MVRGRDVLSSKARGLQEGKPMDAEELKRAQRKAALLKAALGVGEVKKRRQIRAWEFTKKTLQYSI